VADCDDAVVLIELDSDDIEPNALGPALPGLKIPVGGARDFARHERLAAAGRFVVEEDAVRREQPVGIPIVADDIVGIDFRRSIGALRLEGGGFILGWFAAPNISLEEAW
jgi:hypothetical protein